MVCRSRGRRLKSAAPSAVKREERCLRLPDGMRGAMVTVPLPERAGSTADEAACLRTALLVEDGVEVQLHAWRGRLWVRVSAQIYNDMSDINRLAEAVARRLRSL